MRTRPLFFDTVAAEARRRWDQLESDEVLAAPWWQLFKQLRSNPEHVLSELLQNADDAGATWARVTVENSLFCFEHNGLDFTEDDLVSLCRFGFSKKRNLHTIGYRGIGFKTTFSLGDRVELITPSLAIVFHAQRFTEPVWMDDEPASSHTKIRVEIDAPEKIEAIQRQINIWCKSPVPLLFFQNIQTLDLAGRKIEKEVLGAGPVRNSHRVRLTGDRSTELMHIWSDLEPFPEEALEEVRQERGDDSFDLPPARVDIVCSGQRESRLFAVLPSNVTLETPFSCNGPFIQDPARTGIKAPSASPTNRWLLERVGRLAGEAFQAWLGNDELELDARAQAYTRLLPNISRTASRELSSASGQIILRAFQATTENCTPLLGTDGNLYAACKCLDLPPELLDVWSAEQNLDIFGKGENAVLAAEVSKSARDALQRWDWLDRFGTNMILTRLKEKPRPPRPATKEALLRLWAISEDSLSSNKRYRWNPSADAERLQILPIRGASDLYAADEIIVQESNADAKLQEDWAFLVKFVHVADVEWLSWLDAPDESLELDQEDVSTDTVKAVELSKRLGLDRRKGLAIAIERAGRMIFDQEDPGDAGIRLAYLVARADIRAPSNFRFLCADGRWRSATVELFYGLDATLHHLPKDWLVQRQVSERYEQAEEPRDREAWRRWALSSRSPFLRFPWPKKIKRYIYSRAEVEDLIRQRGGRCPANYRLVREYFLVKDYDFDPQLVHHWNLEARENPRLWSEIVLGLAELWFWPDAGEATIYQEGNKYKYKVEAGHLPPAWLHRLQQTPCLPDRFGYLRVPAAIYRYTPETAHLEEIEPFLAPEYDRPEFADFYTLLGVQSKPGSVDKLIDRLRALAQSDQPPQPALIDLYRALDRSWKHLDSTKRTEVRAVFAEEPLIFTGDLWINSRGVFQKNTADLPDLPVVWPDLADLPLWGSLDVPPEPTLDLLIKWLKSLHQDTPLSEQERKRIRKILARAPERIWRETGHWLSLSGQWLPHDELQWGASSTDASQGLFLQTKRTIADLSMLSHEVRSQEPFSRLAPLASALESRIETVDSLGDPFQPAWLAELARQILRVRMDDASSNGDDPNETANMVVQCGARLRNTQLQQVADIQVVPYLEHQPVGPPRQFKAAWVDRTVYVCGVSAAVFDDLAKALSDPFPLQELQEAVRACIDREPDWVASYFETHFELFDEPVEIPLALELQPSNNTPQESGFPEGIDDDEWGQEYGVYTSTDEDGASARPRRGKHSQGDDNLGVMIHRFWRKRGFFWVAQRGEYQSEEGVLRQQRGGPLKAWLFDGKDQTLRTYWIGESSLSAGVEVPAEVWHLLSQRPEAYSLLLPSSSGELQEYTGVDLRHQLDTGQLELYPAAYRLRQPDATPAK